MCRVSTGRVLFFFDSIHVVVVFLKQFLGNDSGPWKAVHSLLDLPVDVYVWCCKVYEMVVLDDIIGRVGNL